MSQPNQLAEIKDYFANAGKQASYELMREALDERGLDYDTMEAHGE